MERTTETSFAVGLEAGSEHEPDKPSRTVGARRLRAAVFALAVTAPVVGTMSPAEAQAGPYMASKGGHYGCTNLTLPGCQSQGSIGAQTGVTMHCWIDDSWATGAYRSNRWFYVTAANGVRNFVHSSRVQRQSSVPHCNTHRGISAARWAAMQIGETVPNPNEKTDPGMDRWSGWCYVFAWDAHALSHGAKPLRGYGTAKNTFYAYQKLGRVSRDFNHGNMRVGAIVFWASGTAGHAAIYAGQGMVVSTQGYGTGFPPVARLALSHLGSPAGWVSPDSI